MFKKLLFTGFLIYGICFTANIGFAAEAVDAKSPCSVHCNSPEKYEQVDNKICPKCGKKCTCDCECKKDSCAKCKCCNKKMKKFIEKADCFVGLTPEQKAQAEKIRKSTFDKVAPLKKQICCKKKEIEALRLTRLAQREMDRRIDILEKEIKCLKKEVKKEIKKSEKCYKKLLNSEQKKLYKQFKKEWKNCKGCCKKNNCKIKKEPCKKGCPINKGCSDTCKKYVDGKTAPCQNK